MTSSDQRQQIAQFPPFLPRTLIQVAGQEGADCARLCHGIGLLPEDLNEPSLRLSYRQVSRLVRRAEAELSAGVGLRVGDSNVLGSLGLVGYAMSLCPTLGAAITLAMQYQALAGSLLHVDIGESADTLWLSATLRFPDLDIQAFAVEELFASSLKYVRLLIGNDFKPEALSFAYPAPHYAAAYEQLFKAPLKFCSSSNHLVMNKSWLTTPLPSHEPLALKQALEMLAEAASQPMNSHDLALSVERSIAHSLRQGVTIADVSAQLNLSIRTLRRRLSESDLSFESLLDQVRKTRALSLLGQPNVAIDTVASEAGYSDARAFRRAFKRWTGESPSSYSK
jgi:AraC-like DNA-binding protein